MKIPSVAEIDITRSELGIGKDNIFADDWLVRQLAAFPERVDQEKTTNMRFLMESAALSLRLVLAQPRTALFNASDAWHDYCPADFPTLVGQDRVGCNRILRDAFTAGFEAAIRALATQPAAGSEG